MRSYRLKSCAWFAGKEIDAGRPEPGEFLGIWSPEVAGSVSCSYGYHRNAPGSCGVSLRYGRGIDKVSSCGELFEDLRVGRIHKGFFLSLISAQGVSTGWCRLPHAGRWREKFKCGAAWEKSRFLPCRRIRSAYVFLPWGRKHPARAKRRPR